MPACVLADRATLEESARRGAQAINLANGALMCRVLTKYLMFVDPDDLGVTPRLCLDGFWESWVTAALARVLRPGAFCVDVGANHGYYTMLLADAAGPHGRVLALEPNPALAELLALTLEVNGFDRRTPGGPAGGDRRRRAHGAAGHPEAAAGPAPPSAAAPSAADAVIEVDAASIDDLTASWPRVDLIKIDAEGAEPAIWRGMRRTIDQNPALNRRARVRAVALTRTRADFSTRSAATASRCATSRTIRRSKRCGRGGPDRRDGDGWTLFLDRN
jgi:FkbM family methyltransferase